MSREAVPGDAAGELRRAFDHAFTVAPERDGRQEEALIAIRVGGQPYALLRRQILGLARMPRMTPVPSPIPHLAGVIGLRGQVVPVFRLAGFVETRAPVNNPRWLALVDGEEVLGLGFDELDGQFSVPVRHLYQQEDGPDAGPVRQVARIGTTVRPILEVPLIVEQACVAAHAKRKGNEEP